MGERRVDIGRAFSLGWNAFKKYPGLAIGAFFIYIVVIVVGMAIPFLNFVFYVAVLPFMVGGYYVLGLNMVRDNNPKLEDIFSGYKQFAKWMGVFWLFAAVMIPAMIPYMITYFMVILPKLLSNMNNVASSSSPFSTLTASEWTVIGIGYAISLVLATIVRLILGFAWFAAADGADILGSFKESIRMTQGIRLQLLWAFIVLFLFALSGVIALGIGAIVTSVIAWLVFAGIYVDLRGQEARSLSGETEG